MLLTSKPKWSSRFLVSDFPTGNYGGFIKVAHDSKNLRAFQIWDASFYGLKQKNPWKFQSYQIRENKIENTIASTHCHMFIDKM